MRRKKKNKFIGVRTDEETYQFYKKIAENESRTLSNVVHLALRKVRKNFDTEEVTREEK